MNLSLGTPLVRGGKYEYFVKNSFREKVKEAYADLVEFKAVKMSLKTG